MMILLRSSRLFFSKERKSMMDSFKYFLEHDAFASVRQEPHQKDRKYVNVEISESFKKSEEIRKQKRLEHVKARKKLLQQKLSIESKLLTSQQTEELNAANKQITSLQTLLEVQERELSTIQQKLQQTQADLILIEGYRKIVILNKITYLKHLNFHPTGLVLQPQVMKMIQNIHYLVNNNLPVNKYKLFEIMPELFQTEINQLDESIKKLIEEKKLDPESDPSGRIRFFMKHITRFRDPEQDMIDLQNKRDQVFHNMELEIERIVEVHMPYIKTVDAGETPFRNTEHMIAVMLSDSLNLKFTPEEEALKKTLREVVELKQKFKIYNEQVNNQCVKMRFKYIQPPEWIKNHPVLLERYEKLMVKFTNPQPIQDTLPDDIPNDDGRAYLEEKLKNLAIEKYHPIVEKLWNEGKRDELIARKKEMEIDFLNDATNIHEEYLDMIAESKDKEEFLKIPKKSRELEEQKHASVTLDDLTKSIMINNSNPSKYNLAFFTQFLGLENVEETRKLFNSFSYMRVPEQRQKEPEQLEFHIMKFKE